MLTIANCDGDDRDLAAYGRLLRELARYIAVPNAQYAFNATEYSVEIWRAGVKKFKRVGTAANYRKADLLMRQHIYAHASRRARRYPAQRQPPLYIRCEYCDYWRRRSSCADLMCYDCYHNIWSNETLPDDYPAFDADQLFR